MCHPRARAAVLTPPRPPSADPTGCSVSQSVQRVLREHVLVHGIYHDGAAFRAKYLYQEKTDTQFKAVLPELEEVYARCVRA